MHSPALQTGGLFDPITAFAAGAPNLTNQKIKNRQKNELENRFLKLKLRAAPYGSQALPALF